MHTYFRRSSPHGAFFVYCLCRQCRTHSVLYLLYTRGPSCLRAMLSSTDWTWGEERATCWSYPILPLFFFFFFLQKRGIFRAYFFFLFFYPSVRRPSSLRPRHHPSLTIEVDSGGNGGERTKCQKSRQHQHEPSFRSVHSVPPPPRHRAILLFPVATEGSFPRPLPSHRHCCCVLCTVCTV